VQPEELLKPMRWDMDDTFYTVSYCNVSWKTQIDAESLAGVITGKIPLMEWPGHLSVFMDELPIEAALGFLTENGITLQEFKKFYDGLNVGYKNKRFEEVLNG
jgi:hypothetical protein